MTLKSTPSPLLKQATALHQAGRLDEAKSLYQKVLAQQPKNSLALHYLGMLAAQQGRHADAVKLITQAIQITSNIAVFHANLGNSHAALGNKNGAIAAYREAVRLNPDWQVVQRMLGNLYLQLEQFAAAADRYRLVLGLPDPELEDYKVMAYLLHELGHIDDAIACNRRVIMLQPNVAEAHCNLGCLLQEKNLHQAAMLCYQHALTLDPNYAVAHNNLADALSMQGNLDAAVQHFQLAIELNPAYFSAHSNLLNTLNYHTGYTPPMRLAEARRYGANVHAHAVQMTHSRPSETGSGQGLRVGLVSGDFKHHPVGFFLESVLPHLTKTGLTLFAYSTQNKQDALTSRLQPHFAAWRSIAHLDDAAAAQQIHADGIHILIDLAGHTALNRLPVFAYKPAPIQASWLGYGASTGVQEMDYLLADPISLPVALQANFSEHIYYLPDTRLCFTPPADAPAVAALPAFKNGHLTFGCVQNSIKLNDQVLALWGQILRALPDARLRLQNKQLTDPNVHQTLLQRLAMVGIAADRVILAPPVSRDAYLHSYAEVDMLLDTFPFAGGTTTCEALWMGVPTLTLGNDTLIGRQGASMMSCVGLPDWVANDTEEYVHLAIAHASDLPKLAQVRAELRQRAQSSPLFDAARFAQNLSAALHGMWQKYIHP